MSEIVLPDDGDDGTWGGDPDLEARLLAWIMGEASEFEVESLERLIAKRPEVEGLKRRLEEMHGLVDDVVNSGVDEAWRLSPMRRAQVMRALGIGKGNGGNGSARASIGGGRAKEVRIRRASRKVLWAAAACLMINVVLLVWLVGKLAGGERRMLSTTGAAANESKWQMIVDGSESIELLGAAPVERSAIQLKTTRQPGTASVAAPKPDADALLGMEMRAVSRSGNRAGEALASLSENLDVAEKSAPEAAEEITPDPFGDVVVHNGVEVVPTPTFQGGIATGQSTNIEFRELTAEEKLRRASIMAQTAPTPPELPVPVPEPEPEPAPAVAFDLDSDGDGEVAGGWGGGVLPPEVESKGDAGEVNLNAANLSGQEAELGDLSLADREWLEANRKTGATNVYDSGLLPPVGFLPRGDEAAGRKSGRGGGGAVTAPDGRKGVNLDFEGQLNYRGKDGSGSQRDLEAQGLRGGTEAEIEVVREFVESNKSAQDEKDEAQRLRRFGKMAEAKESLEQVLTVDPNKQRAKEELEVLDDAVRTNPNLTLGDTENVDKVRRHLYTAEGYKNLGLYDQAVTEYQKTLKTDPANSAARRGMEAIHKLKSDYYDAAYDETRARLLSQVDSAWEMAVPPPVDEGEPDPFGGGGALVSGPGPGTAVENLSFKMENVVIPEVNLENTTVEEAVDYLRQRAREEDKWELDPAKKGINMVIRRPRLEGRAVVDEELDAEGGLGGVDPGQARIKNLKLKDVTLGEALKQVADQAGLRYKVDEFAVTMLPKGSGEGDDILTKRFKVGPNFLTDLESGDESGEADRFSSEDFGGAALKARRPLVDVLKESGIDFPPGATAQYIPTTGTLIVSNTPENLDLMDQMTESLNVAGPPPGVDAQRFEQLFKRRSGETADPVNPVLEEKLRNMIIPVVDFDDTTVEEAIDFFRSRARELDHNELDPRKKGLSIRIQKPEGADNADYELDAESGLGAMDPGTARVKELKLRNVPLGTALQYVCDQARLRYEIDENGITFVPLGSGEADDIEVRSWEIHPELMSALRSGGEEDWSDEDDPFGEPMTKREKEEFRQQLDNRPLVDILKDSGIDFPPGATVHYMADTGVLIVRNTPANIDLVDQLFESVAVEVAQKETSQKTLETSAKQEPFSTFSLHVSDVSFKLAKATLDKGEWPAAGQIRVEEFVNAFDYGDPVPSMEEKVACQIEQAAHPFMQQRNLLRISMRTAALGRSGGMPLALTVLLDNSGSMERLDRAESVQRAFELLAAQLNGNDQITLISFARTPRLLADRMRGDQAGTLAQMVATTPSEGGTNLEEALRLGLSKAREQKVEGGQNRVILLTDGAANLGNAKPAELARLVETMREEGIAFDACGVGAEGLNDEILESLTRKGDGRYYFLDRPEDADEGFAKQIAGALRPAAKNVKVQVEFNPERVGRYKLFGFEKHKLEKEDFRNDSVDAAEMAAEEEGTAVYQVQVRADGQGEIGNVSVRFLDMTRGQMVERRWTIPYVGDAPGLESAAPALRLAASAAMLGEKLNGSAIGERVRLEELGKIVNPLSAVYPHSGRVRELLEMVEKARGLE